MSYRGSKRPHIENLSHEDIENLQNKYERLWDELDIAFVDISKIKKETANVDELNEIRYINNEARIKKIENELYKFKKETKSDLRVNHSNINYVSMRLFVVVIIYVLYVCYLKYKDTM